MTSTYTICNNILEVPLNTEVRQVYIWALSLDNKFILVAKANKKYHQPGGHPEIGESIKQTVIREMFEEAGVELKESDLEEIKFIGYYTVNENNETYFQLRFLLKLNKNSNEYYLSAHEKDTEKEEDKIKYVNFFTLDEVNVAIPWLKDDGKLELKSVLKSLQEI